MAAKKSESKIILERTYNVPLRKAFSKASKYRRAKKAVNAMKEFLAKHMKSEQIKIMKSLNEKLWQDGIRNPPHHVKIIATKDDQGVVKADLAEAAKTEATPKKQEKKKPATEVKEKIKPAKKSTLAGADSKKGQKQIEEAEEAEKLEQELEKEETADPEFAETEEDIKETIDEIKSDKKSKR